MQCYLRCDKINVKGRDTMKPEEKQVIIVNKNPVDLSMQILIPPFRPINLYEIEDNLEAVLEEIQTYRVNENIKRYIVSFFTAIHDAMNEKDILPLVEYFFLEEDFETFDAKETQAVFETLQEFIRSANDENRLMH